MFYILVFLSPLVISLLSRFTLGEPIGLRKAIALLLGFAGVVIAVAPWNHGQGSHDQRVDLIGVAACMVCVSCFSVNMVWSRVLTRTEHPESLAFCSGIVTALAGFALCGLHAHALTPTLSVAVVAMGIFCAAGTLCFYVAVKHTSAGNVSLHPVAHRNTCLLARLAQQAHPVHSHWRRAHYRLRHPHRSPGPPPRGL
jgi:drug/metabolite transporter (DMT)-like permease